MEAGCGDVTGKRVMGYLWDMGYEMVPVWELKIRVVGYPCRSLGRYASVQRGKLTPGFKTGTRIRMPRPREAILDEISVH